MTGVANLPPGPRTVRRCYHVREAMAKLPTHAMARGGAGSLVSGLKTILLSPVTLVKQICHGIEQCFCRRA
ncbi:hypothetical protein ACKKBF_B31705 [Auxenochlorella protothecoides x Auxenochlorella symbiontica]